MEPQPLRAPRACDECRSRKTRCDQGSPCQRCKAAGLTCRVSGQGAKKGRDDIQGVQKHETRMDRMERRLGRIEGLLERLCSTPHSPASYDQGDREVYNTPASQSDVQEQSRSDLHTGVAAETSAAEHHVASTVSQDKMNHDAQLTAALEALRNMVARVRTDSNDHTSDLVSDPPKTVPTADEVMGLLQRMSIRKPNRFDWLSSGLVEQFNGKCRAMYSGSKIASPADKLLVYSMLSNLCYELSDGPDPDYYHMLSKSFASLLLNAIQSFPLFTPPSLDAAEALMNAATTTISMCRPTLTWTLVSAACRMLLTLRYHQLSSSDERQSSEFTRKIILFWSCYILDRTVSLRLGRLPSIQDHEISTPMLQGDKCGPVLPALLDFWVRSGRVHGRIVTQLHDKEVSQDERINTAITLADELEAIHKAKVKANDAILPLFEKSENEAADMMLAGEEVIHCSTMSMALFAIPQTHPKHARALETARKYLRTNVEIHEKYSFKINIYTWIAYCHWHILNGPLTPFTGIFSHIIAHPLTSASDLKLLQDFIAVLQPAIHLSEGISKFYQLCSVFVRVAEAYMHAKMQQQQQQREESDQQTSKKRKRKGAPSSISLQDLQPTIGEFDEQLAALGFQNAPGDAIWPSPGGLDWYSGNAAIYGLLDQDLQDLFDPSFPLPNVG